MFVRPVAEGIPPNMAMEPMMIDFSLDPQSSILMSAAPPDAITSTIPQSSPSVSGDLFVLWLCGAPNNSWLNLDSVSVMRKAYT